MLYSVQWLWVFIMDLQVWFKVIWFSDWPQKRFKMYERYGLLLLTLPLAGGYDLPCSERSSLPTWFSVHSVGDCCEDYHLLCKGNNKVHAFRLPPNAQPPTTKRQSENLWTLEVSSLREVLNVKPLVLKSFKFKLSISSEVWQCFYLAVFPTLVGATWRSRWGESFQRSWWHILAWIRARCHERLGSVQPVLWFFRSPQVSAPRCFLEGILHRVQRQCHSRSYTDAQRRPSMARCHLYHSRRASKIEKFAQSLWSGILGLPTSAMEPTKAL